MTSFHLRSSRVLAAIATACAGALAAGCGTAGTSPTTTVTVTAPPTASASPSQTSTSTPAQTASPAGPAACPTRDLRVSFGLSQGTAGSTYTVIDFTNIGTVTCTLYGYPGVSLAGGSPVTQIGQAADENSATSRKLVTLAPGAVANALLRILHAQNIPARSCHPVTSTYVQIFPPNQTTPVYLAYTATACTKPVHLLTINAMRPGSGG